jgi:hypothetical protein
VLRSSWLQALVILLFLLSSTKLISNEFTIMMTVCVGRVTVFFFHQYDEVDRFNEKKPGGFDKPFLLRMYEYLRYTLLSFKEVLPLY